MIELRPYNELGGAQHGWLDTRHHFSFADYYNPKRMSWGQLRVWNDDTIAARSGFPPHPHRDMESSPMCAAVPLPTKIISVTVAALKQVTCR